MAFRLANVDGRAVLVDGAGYHDLEAGSDGALGPDPMAAVAAHRQLHAVAERLAGRPPDGALDDAVLGPPVPRPVNVFGVGLNYPAHAAESGVSDPPAVPVVFAKFPTCISAPGSDVVLEADSVDYEAELVVAIGTGGRRIAAADAWAHVAGVTGGQDISDRALQFAATPPHFDLAKSRDTYGPIGPVLVSPDAFADPDDITLRCEVDGELRQHASTRDMFFGVPALIEHLSGILTLQPGDLIFTGTPDGVGMARGALLRPGDVITTTVEGVGSFTSRCV